MIDDLIEGWKEMQAALPDYLKAEAYFEGTVPEVFASAAARRAIEETGADYRFNLAKTPVQVMVDRVELVAVTAPENDAASAVIEDVWDANGMDVHTPDLFTKAFEYGDAYLQVWPVEPIEAEVDDDGDTTALEVVAEDDLESVGVELSVHGPKHCRAFYDPENQRRMIFVIKRWPVGGSKQQPGWRADVYYADRIERYELAPGGDPAEADAWKPFLDPDQDLDDWLLDNPHGQVPFFHYRTATPYGRPDHRDAYSPQDAVNKLLITQLTTTDSHGFPQRWALTDKGNDLDTAGDGPEWDDDLDGDDTVEGRRGGSSSQLKSGPGTIMDLIGKRAVGQFEAANPAVFLDPTAFYVRLMAQMTTTPLHYFDPSGGTPSGESLKVADAPLVKKAKRRTTILVAPVDATWRFVLKLRGIAVERLDIRWAPVESSSGASDWETVKAKQDAGVPRSQSLVEAGYEVEQVEQWHAEEAESMGLARQAELMASITDSVYRLSAAVSLGTLSQDQAGTLITTVLGESLGQVDFEKATGLTKPQLPSKS